MKSFKAGIALAVFCGITLTSVVKADSPTVLTDPIAIMNKLEAIQTSRQDTCRKEFKKISTKLGAAKLAGMHVTRIQIKPHHEVIYQYSLPWNFDMEDLTLILQVSDDDSNPAVSFKLNNCQFM
jgi:hypothetical protein